MAVKARNEITLVKVVDGTDGDSGIIVSSTAPSKPTVGQLWQTATGQPIKRWTGSSWVIHYISVDNLNVDTLSAIAADLGNITGGSLNINNKFIVDKLGNLTATSGKIAGMTVSSSGFSYTRNVTISGKACTLTVSFLSMASNGHIIDWTLKVNDGSADEFHGYIDSNSLRTGSVSADYVNVAELYSDKLYLNNNEQPIFELVETVDLEI